jgi:hypothetical protein
LPVGAASGKARSPREALLFKSCYPIETYIRSFLDLAIQSFYPLTMHCGSALESALQFIRDIELHRECILNSFMLARIPGGPSDSLRSDEAGQIPSSSRDIILKARIS